MTPGDGDAFWTRVLVAVAAGVIRNVAGTKIKLEDEMEAMTTVAHDSMSNSADSQTCLRQYSLLSLVQVSAILTVS